MSAKPADELTLREGTDYTVEAGCWIFTADYLRRRGYCCGNGCRHCPYGAATPGRGADTAANNMEHE